MTKHGMTENMHRVYRYWLRYHKTHPPVPNAPTFREAATDLEMGGPGVVKEIVDRLAEMGLMVQIEGRTSRNWEALTLDQIKERNAA